jgi:hypothetical protein
MYYNKDYDDDNVDGYTTNANSDAYNNNSAFNCCNVTPNKCIPAVIFIFAKGLVHVSSLQGSSSGSYLQNYSHIAYVHVYDI